MKLIINANCDESKFSQSLEIIPLSGPQSNIICFYVKPKNMIKISLINEFNMKLIEDYFPHPTNHIQDFNYFISKTKLKGSKLMAEDLACVFSGLEMDTDSLQLLRVVVLNKWSSSVSGNGLDYMTDFLDEIKNKSLELMNEY
jgi:hypothetical protein